MSLNLFYSDLAFGGLLPRSHWRLLVVLYLNVNYIFLFSIPALLVARRLLGGLEGLSVVEPEFVDVLSLLYEHAGRLLVVLSLLIGLFGQLREA